ncbi:hypothetical protein Dimus_014447 [Dionaea muscipula]
MDPSVGVPIFVDTNLGTRIAVAVSPDISAGDLKRELERAHANCFPELGSISVGGLMVKKKSILYHLPDSFPVKCVVSKGGGQSWFLHAKLNTSNVTNCFPNVASGKWMMRKRKRIRSSKVEVVVNGLEETGYDYLSLSEGCNCDSSDAIAETPRESLSKSTSLSVSDIIERYFSNLLELNQVGSP